MIVVSHVTPIKILVAHAVGAPLAALFRMELSTGVGQRRVVLRRGPEATARVDAALQRPAARAPGRCSTRSAGEPRSKAATTTSSWVPEPRRRPASTVQPRSASRRANAAGVRASRPSSSSARTSRPLVALLKWLTTCRRAVHLVEHPHGDHPAAEVGGGPPERGVRRGAEVDDETAARPPATTGSRWRAPVGGHASEPGERDATGQPVRRDPLARADQRRTATTRSPAGSAPAVRRGVERASARGRRRARRCRSAPPAPWAGRGAVRCVVRRRPGPALSPSVLIAASSGPRHRSTRASTIGAAGVGQRTGPEVERPPRRGTALPSLGGSRISTPRG